MKKLFSLFGVFLLALSTLTGCGKKEPTYGNFFYDLSQKATNLDPQTTSSYESLLLLANMMEGLVKYGKNGEILPALASSWDVSADGTSYTFHLRKELHWVDSTGEAKHKEGGYPTITAHDFVFAFQRLFTASNQAPFASRYSIIQNSQAILTGEQSLDTLGIMADDDLTLRFTLDAPSSIFLSLLAQPPAFPCNEDFFYSTKGAYGLNSTDLLYCGSFYLSKWRIDVEDPFYGLTKNTFYYDAEKAKADSVTFSIVPNEADRLTNFLEQQTDSILLSGDTLRKIDLSNYQTEFMVDTTWSLLFNTQKAPFTNISVRQAFSSVLLSTSIESSLPEWMTPTDSLLPPALRFSEESYRESVGETILQPIDNPQLLLQEGLSAEGLEAIPEITFLYPEGDEYTAIAQRIQRIWKDQLGLYINVTPLPMTELEKTVKAGEYDMAFLPIRSDNILPISFLEQFTSASKSNLTGFQSESFDALYHQYSPFSSEETNNSLCREMEQILQNEAVISPISYQSSFFVRNPKVHDIVFNAETNLMFYAEAYLDQD